MRMGRWDTAGTLWGTWGEWLNVRPLPGKPETGRQAWGSRSPGAGEAGTASGR